MVLKKHKSVAQGGSKKADGAKKKPRVQDDDEDIQLSESLTVGVHDDKYASDQDPSTDAEGEFFDDGYASDQDLSIDAENDEDTQIIKSLAAGVHDATFTSKVFAKKFFVSNVSKPCVQDDDDDDSIDHEAEPKHINYVAFCSDGVPRYNGKSDNPDGTCRRLKVHIETLKAVFDDPHKKKKIKQRQVYDGIIEFLRRAPGVNWVKFIVVADGQTGAQAHNHELAFMHENKRRNPTLCSNKQLGHLVGNLQYGTPRFDAYAKKVYDQSMLIAKEDKQQVGLTTHDLEDPGFLAKARVQHADRYGTRICAHPGCSNKSGSATYCGRHCASGNKTCAYAGCNRSSRTATYCFRHAAHGNKICAYAGCSNKSGTNKYCTKHSTSVNKTCAHGGCSNKSGTHTYCSKHSASGNKICAEPGCSNKSNTSKFCGKHRPSGQKICAYAGCSKKSGTNKYCTKHRPSSQKICAYAGCSTKSGTNKYCGRHCASGDKICAEPDCPNKSGTANYCRKHRALRKKSGR